MGTDPEMLVSLAKSGSGPALSRLLERHRGALEVQARLQVGRRLRTKLDIDDLIQELSLEAHRDIRQFRGRSEGEFVCWLRKVFATILSNQVRRYLGTRRRDLRRERQIAGGRDDTSRPVIDGRLVAPQSSPSQQAARRERAELLAEALETLPGAYREVIVLQEPGGPELRGSGRADGPYRGQRQEHLAAGPEPTPAHAGGALMNGDSRGQIVEPSASSTEEPSSAVDDPRVAAGLDEYLAELQAGRRPSRVEFVDRHPEIAEALDRGLDVLEFLHATAGSTESRDAGPPVVEDLPPETVLGDYRLIREVGRGGMGVVYEAQQISLGRRVAVKVLSGAGVLDPRRLQRFRIEAQAVAQLNHPHIVPIFAVGFDAGIHYYAMQYVEGCTLAEVLDNHPGCRREAGDATTVAPDRPAAGCLVGRARRSLDAGRALAHGG